MSAQPPLVFIIYAREDERFRAELKKQLLPMEKSEQLRVWTDRNIIAGEQWEPAIKKQLESADVILVLVSSDYFQSDYIHEVELRKAIERHERGEARVVPVIVRPCDWETDPIVKRLQVLPTDGVPVEDTRHWHTEAAAWVDVVRGVRRALQQLQEERAAASADRLAAEQADAARATAEVEHVREAESDRQREQLTREAETAARQADETAWHQALRVSSPEAFRAYLSAHPGGMHAYEARQRARQTSGGGSSGKIRNMAIAVGAVLIVVLVYVLQPTESGNTPLDDDAWASTKKENTVSAYRNYLSPAPYTEGRQHAAEARHILDSLQTDIHTYLSDALYVIEDPDMRVSCVNSLEQARHLDPDNARIKEIRDMLDDSGMVPHAKRALENLLGKSAGR
ncbi:MAG: toll/interleukin-1 receptor domain-containing protein [Saprospiraceae bacterium]